MGYRRIKEIGKGGNGIVYKCISDDGKYYAVKELHRTGFTGEIRFKREFYTVRTLRHPNIILIKSGNMSPAQGNPFYVMEYMGGGSLRDKINDMRNNQKVFSQNEAIDIIKPVVDALFYAHTKRIYHRDLKPENILFNSAEVVKVADWGIGRFVDWYSMRLTMGGMGTYNYCSPEQQINAHNVDGRTDIYSLGKIFYEMLTGSIPIWDESRIPSPPSSQNRTVSRIIDKTVLDMMNPNLVYRCKTMNLVRLRLLLISRGRGGNS